MNREFKISQNPKATMRNIKEIADWVEARLEKMPWPSHGRPQKGQEIERTVVLTVRVPESTSRDFDSICEDLGVSRGRLLAALTDAYLIGGLPTETK